MQTHGDAGTGIRSRTAAANRPAGARLSHERRAHGVAPDAANRPAAKSSWFCGRARSAPMSNWSNSNRDSPMTADNRRRLRRCLQNTDYLRFAGTAGDNDRGFPKASLRRRRDRPRAASDWRRPARPANAPVPEGADLLIGAVRLDPRPAVRGVRPDPQRDTLLDSSLAPGCGARRPRCCSDRPLSTFARRRATPCSPRPGSRPTAWQS
jgi:hypothetical protein